MLWYFQFYSWTFFVTCVVLRCPIGRPTPTHARFVRSCLHVNEIQQRSFYVFQWLALCLIKTFLGAIAFIYLCCRFSVVGGGNGGGTWSALQIYSLLKSHELKCHGFCCTQYVIWLYRLCVSSSFECIPYVLTFTSHHCRHFRCWSGHEVWTSMLIRAIAKKLRATAATTSLPLTSSSSSVTVDVIVQVPSLKWSVVCARMGVCVWGREPKSP